MEENKIYEAKIKDLKAEFNTRIRKNENFSDLMQSIKKYGVLEPIGVNEKNEVVFGNRRLEACRKLGYETIKAMRVITGNKVNLVLTNIEENMKRENVGSIEIGKAIEELLKLGMRPSEICERLSLNKTRYKSILSAYKVTKGTEFEKRIFYKQIGRSSKGIPESVIWHIQNSLSRVRNGKISDEDWHVLLDAIDSGEFKTKNIPVLRKVFDSDKSMPMKEAIKKVEGSKVMTVNLILNTKRFEIVKKKLKSKTDTEVIKKIIYKYDGKLI